MKRDAVLLTPANEVPARVLRAVVTAQRLRHSALHHDALQHTGHPPSQLYDALPELTKRGETVLHRAEALEQKVILMEQVSAEEEPGPLTADIVYEKRGRKLEPRLHVPRRNSGQAPPSER